MKIYRGGPMWRFQPFPNCSYSFDFTEEEVPCKFHRLMQKWLLGFSWSQVSPGLQDSPDAENCHYTP